MASIPSYTGNKLKDEILFLLVCAVRVDRDMLNIMHPSASYISQVLRDLQENGYILLHTKTKPYFAVLAKGGIELIRRKDPASYEHYMRISNQNKYGWTDKHMENARRAAGVITQMHAAGVLVGPQKPTLQEMMADQDKKLDVRVPVFYLNREIRYADEQRESRAYITRSSGMLFSEGIRAAVYNCMDATMQIQRNPELEAEIRLIRQTRDIYRNPIVTETQDSIVFCKDDAAALRIFGQRSGKKGGRQLIGDAVWDRTFTGTDFRYIPCTPDGLISLRCITKMTREDFLDFCFTEEEIEAAKKVGMGDAIINGLTCYEYLSSNVSKLAQIKSIHADLSKVGIVCWAGQEAFVKAFLGEEIRTRVVRKDKILEIIMQAETV